MHVQDICPETDMSKYSIVIFHFGQPATANLSRNRYIQIQWRHVPVRTACYSQSVQKHTCPDTVTSCSTSNSQVQLIVPDTSRLLSLSWLLTVRLCRRVTLQTVVAVLQIFRCSLQDREVSQVCRLKYSATICTLKMEVLFSFETLQRCYQTTWRDVL
jgi:hypothetical protein